MRHQLAAAVAAALALASGPAAAQVCGTTAGYDASAAWRKFDEYLRLDYAYLARGGPELETALALARTRALAAPDQLALSRVLQQFTTIFADPHFSVGPFCGPVRVAIPSASDVWAAFEDGQAVVVDVRAGSAADREQVRPGWRVLRIGTLTPDEAVADVFGDYLVRPSAVQRDFALNLAMAGRLGEARTIEFHDGSRARTVNLPTGWSSPAPKPATARFSVSEVEGTTVIRFHNSLGDTDTIEQFRTAIAAVVASGSDRLVLDLRDTPGGGTSSVARGILAHFVSRETPYQIHAYPYEERRYGVPRRAIELVQPREPLFRGRVVAIGGRWTGSMGEGLLMGLEAAGVRTVGSPLADQLGGGYLREALPNTHIQIWLANEALFHVDGRAREDFLPQTVLRSADRNPEGEDPGLRAALDLLRAPTE